MFREIIGKNIYMRSNQICDIRFILFISLIMRITYCEKLLCEKSRQNYAVSWQRRDLEIGMPGVEFRLEGRAGSSFLVGKHGNREARRRRTRQRRVNATYVYTGW